MRNTKAEFWEQVCKCIMHYGILDYLLFMGEEEKETYQDSISFQCIKPVSHSENPC